MGCEGKLDCTNDNGGFYPTIGRSSAGPSNALRGSRIILPPRVSPGPRNQNEYEICCGRRETHQEAPDASSTSGTSCAARQKLGYVVVRHFRDWLLCCNASRHESLAASPCPRDSGIRIRDSATSRQIKSARTWLSSYLGQFEADLRSSVS